MKRIIAVFIIICLLTVCSCSCSHPTSTERLKIICTVFPQYDFVRNIVRDKADVKMLVPLGTESHDFKIENLTVAELKSVATADLVIYVGGESDSNWITELRSTVKNNGTKWCALTEMTETLEEIISESMVDDHEEHDNEHEHDDNHVHSMYDEHIWTSPKRVIDVVKKISDILAEIDTENAEFYRQNGADYIEQLMSLDERLVKVTAENQGKKLIFGDRFPFRYLFHDYGLDFDAAFAGCSAVSDPSVSQMTSLTQTALNEKAKVIFYMENSKPIFAETIAKAIGGRAELLHSCHTVTKEEILSGKDYVSLMNENIQKLAEALYDKVDS